MRRFAFLWLCGWLLSCGNAGQPTEPASKVSNDTATSSATDTTANVSPTDAPAEQSLTALEEQHALVPSDPSIAADLAYAYAEQENAKALRLADSLLKGRTPEPEKAYYVKAEYFSRMGNVQEAVKNYDAAIAANLHFLDAHMDKGRLLFRQKQYEPAQRAFATGQKLSVKEPQFYFWLAKTQEAMGNRQDAKANYERAFALDKELTEAKEAAERLE